MRSTSAAASGEGDRCATTATTATSSGTLLSSVQAFDGIDDPCAVVAEDAASEHGEEDGVVAGLRGVEGGGAEGGLVGGLEDEPGKRLEAGFREAVVSHREGGAIGLRDGVAG